MACVNPEPPLPSSQDWQPGVPEDGRCWSSWEAQLQELRHPDSASGATRRANVLSFGITGYAERSGKKPVHRSTQCPQRATPGSNAWKDSSYLDELNILAAVLVGWRGACFSSRILSRTAHFSVRCADRSLLVSCVYSWRLGLVAIRKERVDAHIRWEYSCALYQDRQKHVDRCSWLVQRHDQSVYSGLLRLCMNSWKVFRNTGLGAEEISQCCNDYHQTARSLPMWKNPTSLEIRLSSSTPTNTRSNIRNRNCSWLALLVVHATSTSKLFSAWVSYTAGAYDARLSLPSVVAVGTTNEFLHLRWNAYLEHLQRLILLRICFVAWLPLRDTRAHRLELQRAHEAVSELWRQCQERMSQDGMRIKKMQADAYRLVFGTLRSCESALQKHLCWRCLSSWHRLLQCQVQETISRNAFVRSQNMVDGVVDRVASFVHQQSTSLLLRHAFRALLMAAHELARAARQAALEQALADEEMKVNAHARRAHAMLHAVLGRQVRDYLRLTWLSWRILASGAASIYNLRQEAASLVEASSVAFRSRVVDLRLSFVLSAEALRRRSYIRNVFAALKQHRIVALAMAARVEKPVLAYKGLRIFRCTALAAAHRCLSAWALLAGGRPVASNCASRDFLKLPADIPGSVPAEPLAESSIADHDAMHSVLPWEELTALVGKGSSQQVKPWRRDAH